MSARTITIEHGGKTYGGQLGTIKSTRLGFEDHGILTASLVVEWKGGGVSVGGYCLDRPKDTGARDYSRTGTAYGLDYIIRVIETAGVDRWEQLVGKQIVVLFDGRSAWGAQSLGFASTTDDDKVFILSEHSESWRESDAS